MDLIKDDTSNAIVESAGKLIKEKSANSITVRDILRELNITNRVFYNRFHNIGEVLSILYEDTINKVRESLSIPWNSEKEFGQHIEDVATNTLLLTYERKQNLESFIFETDSSTSSNFSWWINEIKKLIETGKKIGYIKNSVDEESISYSIWCFIRGFITDALARNLPIEEAIKQFKYGFRCFIAGVKAQTA